MKEQWEAGIYPLAIMVVLFSGIWPFLKLIMLFLVWFVPTSKLSYKTREKILVILDALGKWSFFDCIILIFLIDGMGMDINAKILEINVKNSNLIIKTFIIIMIYFLFFSQR